MEKKAVDREKGASIKKGHKIEKAKTTEGRGIPPFYKKEEEASWSRRAASSETEIARVAREGDKVKSLDRGSGLRKYLCEGRKRK